MTYMALVLRVACLSLALRFSLFAAGLCVTVVDPADLPLPNALVTVSGLLSEQHRTARADTRGRACFDPIPEGLYSVEAGLIGFLNVRYYPVRVAHPNVTALSFRLPFGDVREGGVMQEAILSGALELDEKSVSGAKICLFDSDNQPAGCTVTNDLGQYAVSVRPGEYRVEIRTTQGEVHRSKINIATSGFYRNRLKFKAP